MVTTKPIKFLVIAYLCSYSPIRSLQRSGPPDSPALATALAPKLQAEDLDADATPLLAFQRAHASSDCGSDLTIFSPDFAPWKDQKALP